MKKIISSILMTITIFFVYGQQSSYQTNNQIEFSNKAVQEAAQTISRFRKTSPFLLNEERLLLLDKIQTYSDSMDKSIFLRYMESSNEASIEMESEVPIIYFYKEAFDKVLYELQNTVVEKGTAVVWLLYNMGFIIKTPSGSFAMDIDHRWAEQLEPYLDFLCATHNHRDHQNAELMDAMNIKGKPVLSNFYIQDEEYCSKGSNSYKIGNFTIHTSLTDHLSNIDDFNTVFRVECGEDAGDFSILHSGDSGFKPERFINVQGPVSMIILRYGATNESNILGTGQGQVETNYATLSHLIELRHSPWPHGQASIPVTLGNLPKVKCKNTFLPFWGEKMTFKNGEMY